MVSVLSLCSRRMVENAKQLHLGGFFGALVAIGGKIHTECSLCMRNWNKSLVATQISCLPNSLERD